REKLLTGSMPTAWRHSSSSSAPTSPSLSLVDSNHSLPALSALLPCAYPAWAGSYCLWWASRCSPRRGKLWMTSMRATWRRSSSSLTPTSPSRHTPHTNSSSH
ncbi:unnamed protein product, partial [Closterium sp. NIES-54]